MCDYTFCFFAKGTENFVIIKGKETKVQQVKISVTYSHQIHESRCNLGFSMGFN